VVAERAEALDASLAGYEAILSRQKYLAGDELTLIDLSHLPYGTLARDQAGFRSTFEKYPSVEKWFNELESRASWKKASA
jgi:glutathione S-transferase